MRYLILVLMIGCSGGRSNSVDVTGRDGPRGEKGDTPEPVKGERGSNGSPGQTGPRGPAGESSFCTLELVEGGTMLRCTNQEPVMIRDGMSGTPGPMGPQGPRGEPGQSGSNGHDANPCTITRNNDGSFTIKCGETSGYVPAEMNVEICIRVGNYYETRIYKTGQFVSQIQGRFNYYYGQCLKKSLCP